MSSAMWSGMRPDIQAAIRCAILSTWSSSPNIIRDGSSTMSISPTSLSIGAHWNGAPETGFRRISVSSTRPLSIARGLPFVGSPDGLVLRDRYADGGEAFGVGPAYPRPHVRARLRVILDVQRGCKSTELHVDGHGRAQRAKRSKSGTSNRTSLW
jgi:hypothetical protein